MDKVPMTVEGHEALTRELEHLKNVERPKISKEIGAARELGDLKENAEYHAAKDKQGHIEGRIIDIQDKLARADIIDTTKLSGDKVQFGARVSLQDVDSEKRVQYRIVGPDEANIKNGTISVSSPVARALIGKKLGDEVTVVAPGGERIYEIVEISWK